MRRTELLQGIRLMKFEEILERTRVVTMILSILNYAACAP